MLSVIAREFKEGVGLYPEDGLAVCKVTPRDKKKKTNKRSATGSNQTVLKSQLKPTKRKL